MANSFFFKSLFIFWYRFLLIQLKNIIVFHKTISNTFSNTTTTIKYPKFTSLINRSDLNDHTLIFDVENTLLKSSSLFPYFMLVAFEAGGLIRAIILVLLYPFIYLSGEKMGLKIMVMTCFFGIKVESFRIGRSVLPKFFLEEVGSEMFEILNKDGKKMGVSNLPRVMVESFLREYLEIDFVAGRELKIFCGYYVGLLDETKTMHAFEQVHEGKGSSDMIGITRFNNISDHEIFSSCKEVYVVTKGDKRSWKKLPKEKYPKALIFHDGRLALRPTPIESLAMLIWLPFALILSVIRIAIAVTLPFKISTPILTFSGLRLTSTIPENAHSNKQNGYNKNSHGHLYVCNHRTLLDPLYISFSLQKKLIAVTYSLSRMSEILAPIKTVRLTRNRDIDSKTMERLLQQGDLVVCPEGTTCREPYLLRFSPLFSEMCDEITPVALDSHVTMFYGTTASGLKALDPVFFLANPFPVYTAQLLNRVFPNNNNNEINVDDSRFDVANDVQGEIGNALGFKCTTLTRKDKYLMLAGNEGVVKSRERNYSKKVTNQQ